jgi:DNA-directed RNA polymerase subunit omega
MEVTPNMAVTKPEIDDLLSMTEQNPFLLCTVASKRACDINNMVRGQHLRVTAIQDFDDITPVVSGEDPVTIAMTEIEDGTLGFVKEKFDEEIKGNNTRVERNL